MRLESLSKNIVKIMFELSKNEGLNRLLTLNVDNPFDPNLSVVDGVKLINPNSPQYCIKPYPFDVEAETAESSSIRVYYNDGDFNENEVISETRLHIDIIVAKDLWLINNGTDSLIRPYEILSRVTDMVGKRSLNSTIKLKFDGFQHLAVNTKFDAIRLYSEYYTVET
jgi:hypothetical protein